VVVIGDGAAAGVDTQCTLRCARAADVAGFEGAVSCRDIGLTVLSDFVAARQRPLELRRIGQRASSSRCPAICVARNPCRGRPQA
jgi:hypothetical protein